MTSPIFEVLSVNENRDSTVEKTLQTELEADEYADQLAKKYGPAKFQKTEYPNRIVKIVVQQVDDFGVWIKNIKFLWS